MDELEHRLRSTLADDRLALPVTPGAHAAVRDGVRQRRRRRRLATVATVGATVAATVVGVALAAPGGHDAVGPVVSTPTPTPSSSTTAVKPPPKRTPGPTVVVPWSATTAWDGTLPALDGSRPSADLALPWCSAGDLTVVPDAVRFQGATGNAFGAVELTARRDCALQGEPVARIETTTGRTLVTSSTQDFRVEPWLALKPGARTTADVQWFQELCGHAEKPAALVVTLPHDGGELRTPYTGAVPRCNATTDPPSVGTLVATAFRAVDGNGPVDTWTPEAALAADLRDAPGQVVAGTALTYVVTLHAAVTNAVQLDPCLPFREQLHRGRYDGPVIATATYVLGCQAAPVVGGDEVRFEMQLQVPPSAPAGQAVLTWETPIDGVATQWSETIDVVAPPAPCRLTDLSVALGNLGAAAGHYGAEIRFTNHGSTACSLHGYPTVRWSTVTGAPGHARAVYVTAEYMYQHEVTTVVLAPGAVASSLLATDAFESPQPSPCTDSRNIRVSVPGDPAAAVVSDVGDGCLRVDVSPFFTG